MKEKCIVITPVETQLEKPLQKQYTLLKDLRFTVRKITAISTGFVVLSLSAGAMLFRNSLASMISLLPAPSEFAVQYYFPPETQQGIILQPETHNYVLCSKNGVPNILQEPASSDTHLQYWIRQEPPQFSRSSTRVQGEPPPSIFERIGGVFRYKWTPRTQDESAQYFYSAGILEQRPEFADSSTLRAFRGGILYYVATLQELPFRCGEALLCGNGTCDEGENELICPPNQPCRKVCEDDCGPAPAVQNFCLPCGNSCQEWHLGEPQLGCPSNEPGIRCAFVEEVCTRTDVTTMESSSSSSESSSVVSSTESSESSVEESSSSSSSAPPPPPPSSSSSSIEVSSSSSSSAAPLTECSDHQDNDNDGYTDTLRRIGHASFNQIFGIDSAFNQHMILFDDGRKAYISMTGTKNNKYGVWNGILNVSTQKLIGELQRMDDSGGGSDIPQRSGSEMVNAKGDMIFSLVTLKDGNQPIGNQYIAQILVIPDASNPNDRVWFTYHYYKVPDGTKTLLLDEERGRLLLWVGEEILVYNMLTMQPLPSIALDVPPGYARSTSAGSTMFLRRDGEALRLIGTFVSDDSEKNLIIDVPTDPNQNQTVHDVGNRQFRGYAGSAVVNGVMSDVMLLSTKENDRYIDKVYSAFAVDDFSEIVISDTNIPLFNIAWADLRSRGIYIRKTGGIERIGALNAVIEDVDPNLLFGKDKRYREMGGVGRFYDTYLLGDADCDSASDTSEESPVPPPPPPTPSSSSSSSLVQSSSSSSSVAPPPPPPPGTCNDCSRCGEGLANVCDETECTDLGPCRFNPGWIGGSCEPHPDTCHQSAGTCNDCNRCGEGLTNVCDATECGNLGPCTFEAGLFGGTCNEDPEQCGPDDLFVLNVRTTSYPLPDRTLFTSPTAHSIQARYTDVNGNADPQITFDHWEVTSQETLPNGLSVISSRTMGEQCSLQRGKMVCTVPSNRFFYFHIVDETGTRCGDIQPMTFDATGFRADGGTRTASAATVNVAIVCRVSQQSSSASSSSQASSNACEGKAGAIVATKDLTDAQYFFSDAQHRWFRVTQDQLQQLNRDTFAVENSVDLPDYQNFYISETGNVAFFVEVPFNGSFIVHRVILGGLAVPTPKQFYSPWEPSGNVRASNTTLYVVAGSTQPYRLFGYNAETGDSTGMQLNLDAPQRPQKFAMHPFLPNGFVITGYPNEIKAVSLNSMIYGMSADVPVDGPVSSYGNPFYVPEQGTSGYYAGYYGNQIHVSKLNLVTLAEEQSAAYDVPSGSKYYAQFMFKGLLYVVIDDRLLAIDPADLSLKGHIKFNERYDAITPFVSTYDDVALLRVKVIGGGYKILTVDVGEAACLETETFGGGNSIVTATLTGPTTVPHGQGIDYTLAVQSSDQALRQVSVISDTRMPGAVWVRSDDCGISALDRKLRCTVDANTQSVEIRFTIYGTDTAVCSAPLNLPLSITANVIDGTSTTLQRSNTVRFTQCPVVQPSSSSSSVASVAASSKSSESGPQVCMYNGRRCCAVDDDRFKSQNGGCEDTTARLAWSRLGPKVKQVSKASTYCSDLNEGGRTDWRMPTEAEMISLGTGGRQHFAFSTTEYITQNGVTREYNKVAWTSSRVDTSQRIGDLNTGAVRGEQSSDPLWALGYYAICVRGTR